MPETKTEPVTPTNTEQKTERRVFAEEFKRDAVRLANERGNVSLVARDLGLHEGVLSHRRMSKGAGGFSRLGNCSVSFRRHDILTLRVCFI